MIRSQRRRHALTWTLLGPTIVALALVALLSRPGPAPASGTANTPGGTP